MSTTGETKVAMEKLEDGAKPATEPEIKYRGWKSMPYVIGNETFEKLGTMGTSSNLLVYLTTIFHMESVAAATLLNVFHGTTNLAPLIGAFLSDTYLGRYKTLAFASIASLIGMVILTLTAAIPLLHPPACHAGQPCQGPSTVHLAALFSSFLFLVIGAGGIRPCNLAFGADQFDSKTESGKRGISSFFNWYYFTFTIAVMISATFIIYIQSDISWTIGLAVPAALMFVSCALFFAGTRLYVRVEPEGSPITAMAQVVVAALHKRRLKLPEEGDARKRALFNPPYRSYLVSKLPYTDQFSTMDKAAIRTSEDEINTDGTAANPWRLCTLQQVEQVKCLLRLIPIWSTNIIYYIATAQQGNYVVFQALQSDRHLGSSNFQIPAASFTVFTMLALTIFVPIYDRLIIPYLRKITGRQEGISLLHRMGIGMAISIVAMVVCAFVEERRRNDALNKPPAGFTSSGTAISSMSSLWLIPQLVLMGLSEAFNIIGQIEFYYRQFPENMRSVAGALAFLGMAISSYLSGLMVTVVHRVTVGGGRDGREDWLAGDLNKGRLDYFYFSIGIIGVLNLIYFIACAKWYRYKGVDSDESEIALGGGANKSKTASV